MIFVTGSIVRLVSLGWVTLSSNWTSWDEGADHCWSYWARSDWLPWKLVWGRRRMRYVWTTWHWLTLSYCGWGLRGKTDLLPSWWLYRYDSCNLILVTSLNLSLIHSVSLSPSLCLSPSIPFFCLPPFSLPPSPHSFCLSPPLLFLSLHLSLSFLQVFFTLVAFFIRYGLVRFFYDVI